jgi:16S rRNA (cytidine1402-2'-O)-methyltransferase
VSFANVQLNFSTAVNRPVENSKISVVGKDISCGIQVVARLKSTLYLIGTPIGNLSDLSSRVREAIDKCDLLLVEDTRVTIKLLNHLDLKKKMLSCHDFNERGRLEVLQRARSENTNVGLISDAGMPLISDPGNFIVKAALELDFNVVAIPGPSAFLLALVASGLPADRFVFEGFLPDKAGDIRKRLEFVKTDPRTLIFYVSPHKLIKTLSACREVLGERRACLCRELTKFHEEYIRGRLAEIAAKVEQSEIKGEFVLVLEGCTAVEEEIDDAYIEQLVEERLRSGLSVKDTANELSDKLHRQKSAIYKVAVHVSQRLAVEAEED